MFNKITFICIVGVCGAVFIDSHDSISKDKAGLKDSSKWQIFKVYYPRPYTTSITKGAVNYEPFYAYPKYEFEYAVSDKKTGDHKHHQEVRDGGKVRGEYSLIEADGSLRKVQYDADDHTGFNAVVTKTINKHGDHAYSVSGHTRQFFPSSYGVKINHYFPNKNYHYQEPRYITNMEKTNKPVKENEDEEIKDENIANEEITEHVEDIKVVEEASKATEPTPTIIEPINDAPVPVTPVNLIVRNENNVEINTKLNSEDVKETNNSLNEIETKEQISLDSEPASSYYHSRMYYITY